MGNEKILIVKFCNRLLSGVNFFEVTFWTSSALEYFGFRKKSSAPNILMLTNEDKYPAEIAKTFFSKRNFNLNPNSRSLVDKPNREEKYYLD